MFISVLRMKAFLLFSFGKYMVALKILIPYIIEPIKTENLTDTHRQK